MINICTIKQLIVSFVFLSLLACNKSNETPKRPVPKHSSVSPKKSLPISETIKTLSKLESHFIAYGLVDVHSINKNILVDLRYSSTNNFLHLNFYGDISSAYLHPFAAEKLNKAQLLLDSIHPGYHLKIWDAARTVTAQQLMWDSINIPLPDRIKYVSNPKHGSLHSYGAAVDITITDEDSVELDMGTDFDSFEPLAYPVLESTFLKSGKLRVDQYKNRQLLRKVMYGAGFFNIQTEWWHFNACRREQAREWYKIIP